MEGGDGGSGLRLRLLGPCTVEGPGAPSALSLMQRQILGRLAIDAPGTVAVAELEEALWGDDPPATSRAAIQNQVSRLRVRLGPEAVLTDGRGYRLGLPSDLAAVAADLRAAEATLDDDAASAHDIAERALGRWRGRPLDELDQLAVAAALRTHLGEVRRALEDVRLAAALAAGRTRWAVAEAERLVAATPGDEHRWALLVRALAVTGRRGDALAALDRAHRSLARDLGLLPGPELRAAEALVLEVEPGTAGTAPLRLVGRDDEVRAVLDALEAGPVTVVVGEAGSGRSALVSEVLRRLRRSGRRAVGVTTSEHPASPVSTLTELVDDLGVRPDDRLAPVDRFVDALVREVEDRGPIVVAVDDVERSGPTTQAALATAAAHDGVTVMVTAERPVSLPGGPEPARVVTLPPLDVAAVADLAATALDGALGSSGEPFDVTWLHHMSGGNPVLLASLLVDPAVLDHLRGGDPEHTLPPAPGVRELVRRRVAHLGPDGRAALEAAAVCGTSSPVAVVVDLVGEAAVAEVVAAGLLRTDGDGRLHFRHGAIQRVVADDVPLGFRIELHHRAAAASERVGAPPATVAAHAVAAAELDPVAAHRWALRAAAAATGAGAHAEAAEWCGRAVVVASDNPALRPRDLVEAMVRRGDALRQAGDPGQADALFAAADAATAIGDVDLLGEAAFAVLQLGATTESGTVHERAMVLAEHALAAVTDADDRARIGAAASLMYSMTSRPERCRALFVAAEAGATSSAARRDVLPFAYLALGHPADLDERERITHELHDLAVAADDPRARFEAAQLDISVALQRGDGDRVRASLAELEDLTPRVGDVGRRWALAYQRAAVAHLDGDLARSEELAELALTTFVDVSPSRAFATYAAQLLPLRLAAGRLGELADQLETLVADQPGVPAWHAALALCVAPTDRAASRHHATLALDRAAPDFTWLAAHVIGGRAAAHSGDEELVHRYRERLEPWSGRVCWAGTCAYGPVDTVLALLAEALDRPAPAARLAGRARDLARRLGAPVFLDELARFTA
ncbi:AAA family ATPase [Iamia sp. SCSIO 61187]|uniref:BTAD domain-containing putative transcriptional regulator n=1 Tax=Iamia sp. SCSIO 61187 TaxID=2722752 RepID=UPI001C63341E|nr:BTAD domain-containing putative transcriptional regulator [Iamia sp. SCSIO 61187]QYG91152.1 AAA family ATPase [Iamia sp. SCSIO 61187]